MAIDPYQPELAKRQKALQIASRQLTNLINRNLGLGSQEKTEFIESFNQTQEALRDYEQAGRDLSEWLSQKK